MAIINVKKIQLAAVSSHKDKILEILQDFGSMHIENIETENTKAGANLNKESKKDLLDIQKIELDYANIEYAIKMLAPYGEKRGLLAGPISLSDEEIAKKATSFDFNHIVKQCVEIEDEMAKAKNELNFLKNEKIQYTPWKNLKVELQNLKGSRRAEIITGCFKTVTYPQAKEELAGLNNLISLEKVHADEKLTYVTIVFSREIEKELKQFLVEHKFLETEMPAGDGLIQDYLKTVDGKISNNEKILHEKENELKKLAKNLDDLKITYDYLNWQKDKAETKRKVGNTEYSFIVNAWVPGNKMGKLEGAIREHTGEFNITELPLAEGENPPVIIENKGVVWPFETLTRMYGLPRHDEMDPTPFLSVFFIIYFALCLTDAAYGLIMFIVMALALKYMKFGEGIKRLVKLLMYCGLATFVIGALFGGWFGLEADKMPEFLTYTNAAGEKMFLFQLVNSVTNPLTVLILALALGFAQILFGTYIKLYHSFMHGNKKDALMDTGSWAFMLTGIGFFVLAAAKVLPSPADTIGQWWVIMGAVILILTQGRDKKNPILKLLAGILSLYGLVNYMSDVLSYSRLLALGLATAIIALAVNVIVNLAMGIPYIGWLFAIVIFVGGHVFNLVLNALGSFIHAGRLQFVEFFSKFLEGGGKEFQAFSKKNKYVYVKQPATNQNIN